MELLLPNPIISDKTKKKFPQLYRISAVIKLSVINKALAHASQERHNCKHRTDTKRRMDTSEAELGIISSEADSDMATSTVDPGLVSSEANSGVTLY